MELPLPAGVIFVDNVLAVAAFYQSVADLTRTHADDQHVVLTAPWFQLTVHALSPEVRPQDTYPAREDTYVKLCFPVSDLARSRAKAAGLGGELFPVEKEWQARGFRACDGRDPEGNIFQLRQSAP